MTVKEMIHVAHRAICECPGRHELKSTLWRSLAPLLLAVLLLTGAGCASFLKPKPSGNKPWIGPIPPEEMPTWAMPAR